MSIKNFYVVTDIYGKNDFVKAIPYKEYRVGYHEPIESADTIEEASRKADEINKAGGASKWLDIFIANLKKRKEEKRRKMAHIA